MKETENIPRPPDDEPLKAQSREFGIKQACCYGLMDGVGLRYITPFALALGASNRVIGLIASLPALLANLSMLLTVKLSKRWSRKRITMVSVVAQAGFWPLLILTGALYFRFGVRGAFPGLAVLAVYTLMVVTGSLCGPAWASWLLDLLPKRLGAYMGRRSRNMGLVAFVSMMAAGFLLDRFKAADHLFLGFVILFSAAIAGRLGSAYFINRQYEPPFRFDDRAHFTLFQFLRRMAGNNFGRFVIYISLFSMAAQISSPFITVYMLKNLEFSYLEYTLVALSHALTALLSLPFWGRFSDRYGNLTAIRLTGIFLPLVPVLWMLSPLFLARPHHVLVVYLVLVQAVAGLVWSGFEIGSGNFIFHAVTPQRIGICSTYFSILNGAGALLGGVMGGVISSMRFSFLGLSPILFVFLLSGAARFVVYLFMHGKVREVRTVEMFTFGKARTSMGNFFRIFRPNFLRGPGDQSRP